MKRTLTCDRCESQPMVKRQATSKDPYHYVLSGLSSVFLAGIEVYRCEQCGGESPLIPRMGELHREIAVQLFRKKGSLKGEELRYLRKHAGLSGVKMAAILGVRPETLSRAENDRSPLAAPTERLVRVVSIMAASDERARELFEKMAEDRTSVRARAKTVLVTDGRGWKAAA